MNTRAIAAAAVAVIGFSTISGCASGVNRALPSADPALRKNSVEFKAYAASAAYPADLPRETNSPIRAEVDYQLRVINLVNLGDTDWKDIDVWVNERYVVRMASLPAKQQRGISFNQLYDKDGLRAPSRGVFLKTLELQHDGTLYSVRARAAD